MDSYFKELKTFSDKHNQATYFRIHVLLDNQQELVSSGLPISEFDNIVQVVGLLGITDTFFLWTNEDSDKGDRSAIKGYLHAIPVRKIVRTTITLYRS